MIKENCQSMSDGMYGGKGETNFPWEMLNTIYVSKEKEAFKIDGMYTIENIIMPLGNMQRNSKQQFSEGELFCKLNGAESGMVPIVHRPQYGRSRGK